MPQPGGDVAFRLPLTLEHENGGWVEQLGPGTTGFAPADPVIVYGPWGCGLCMNCRMGMENYCRQPGGPNPAGPDTRSAAVPFLFRRQRAPRPAVGWPHCPVGLKSRVVVTTTTSAAM
jgi:Zn-dependent alcohol dehydrogenase